MNNLISETDNTLTHAEQMEVCRAFAEFKTPTEVQTMVKDHMGKDLAYNSIKHYLVSKKWNPIVERLRAEYVEPIMSIPVSHKFIRLTRLEDLYRTTSGGDLKLVEKIRACREILSDARTEIEGSKSTHTGDLFLTQINNYSDDELKKKRDEIIARVRGIDVEPTK